MKSTMMSEPIDVVRHAKALIAKLCRVRDDCDASTGGGNARIPNSDDDFADMCKRLYTEVERLQVENTSLRVLPEQIKQLAEKWLRERNNLCDGKAWVQGYRNGLSSCHRELLALLNPNDEEVGEQNENL